MADEARTGKMTASSSDDLSTKSVKRKLENIEPKDNMPDMEPVEKRQAFKLTPPTLIHGVAKPAPKNDTVTATVLKKSFLRPSRLAAPPISQIAAHVTTISESTPLISSTTMSQATKLGTPGPMASNNPFLKPVTDDEEDDDSSKAIEANAQFKKNGCADDAPSGQENSFLRMTSDHSQTFSSESPSANETAGFVFGHKMEERVVATGAESVEPKEEEKPQEFVFGANLSERVKIAAADSNILQTAPAESAIFSNEVAQDAKSNSNGCELEKNAAVLFHASNTKVVMPEVEIKTGEEDEKNVLQIQCKLYQYDSTNSKNWLERGRGNLRLNDLRISAQDQKFQSRLVMRTNGSLRLILNTKIWATMVVEKADSKSVRISAQTEEGEIGVYLIMAAINDADHLFRAIEYRVLHLRQLEEKYPTSTTSCDNASKETGEPKPPVSKENLTPTDLGFPDSTTRSAVENTCENNVTTKKAADVSKEEKDQSDLVSSPKEDVGFDKDQTSSK